jgi:hypothetical protein
LPEEFKRIYLLIKGLQFDETPNYEFIYNCLKVTADDYKVRFKDFDWEPVRQLKKKRTRSLERLSPNKKDEQIGQNTFHFEEPPVTMLDTDFDFKRSEVIPDLE